MTQHKDKVKQRKIEMDKEKLNETVVNYEYQRGASDKEMPDWLITREDNAFGMGRKARLVRDVLAIMSDEFKLKNAMITPKNVRAAVQRHLQGLAQWTFDKHADSSGRVSTKLNEANADYVQSTLASM